MPDSQNAKHKRWMRSYSVLWGIKIPRGYSINAAWGEPAQELCRRIQKHMSIEQTGQWAASMASPTKSADLRLSILQIAQSQIGVREHGANRGKEVEAYLAATGLGGGYAWCAAFVTWCVKNVGYSGSLPKYPEGVIWWEEWAKKNDFFVPFPFARPGDIVTFQFDGDPEPDHIGIVDHRSGNTLYTVEGNTSDSRWADGDGVYDRTRDKAVVHKVIRIEYS